MRHLAVLLALSLVLAACSDDDAGDSTIGSTAAVVTTSQPPDTTPTTSAGAVTTGPGTTTAQRAGASGVEDPYFPELGNGGYDVTHYTIDLTVDPDTAELEAVTTIDATATEALDTFNLDFVGLDLAFVEVDGATAEFVRDGPELRISPDGGIVAGEDFSVTAAYSGRPELIDLISVGVDFGWIQTDEGIYVVAEPDAARTWFPSNDHPTDKATFTIRITVPQPLTAAANGELVEVIDTGDSQTFVWEMRSPMATYLATVVIGEYERVESQGPDDILIRDYIPTSFEGAYPAAFEITAEAMELLTEWFGPYPFDRYGHIVVYDLGGALENQTLSLMGNRALFDDVVVHELAHQWFGNSVSPATWQEIWLNEGFATFAEFLWREHDRGRDNMIGRIEDLHDTLSSIGHFPIADPRETQLFGPAVYWRGGMTLHALRVAVGDDAMKQILQTYFERHADSVATTEGFIAIAEEISGLELDDLFDTWLNTTQLPDLP